MASLGTVAVDVVADTSRFSRDLQDDLQDAGRKVERSLGKTFSGVFDGLKGGARDAATGFADGFKDGAREAARGFDRFADDAVDDLQRIERQGKETTSGLGKGFKRLAGVAIGAFAGVQIGGFLKDAALDAQAFNSAFAATEQIIEATGGAAGLTAEQVRDFAQDISLRIGVDDQELVEAGNILLTFRNVAGESLPEVTELAADLAAAGFGNLESNALQLGKALNDPITGLTALSRSGVTFSDEQKELIKSLTEAGDAAGAQRIILDELQNQVGGTAAATADSTALIANAFGKVREELGQGLIGALDTITPSLLDAIQGLTPVLQSIGEVLAGIVGPVADLIAELGPVIADTFASIIDVVGPLFATLVETLTPILRVLFVVVGDVFEAFGPLLITLGDLFSELFSGDLLDLLSEFALAFVEGLGPGIAVVAEAVGEFAASGAFDVLFDALGPLALVALELLEAFLPLVPVVLDLFKLLVVQRIELFALFAKTLATALVPAVAAFAAVVKAVVGPIRSFLRVLSGVQRVVFDALGSVVDFAGEGLGLLVENFTELPGLVGDALKGLGKFLLDAVAGALAALGKFTADALLAYVGFWLSLPGRIVGALASLGGALLDAVRGPFDTVRRFVTDAVDGIADFIGGLPGRILDLGGDMLAAGRSIIDSFFRGLAQASRFVSDVAKSVVNGIIRFLNSQVVDRLNDALEFSIPLPGLPDISVNPPDLPRIPALARGAVVDGPTLALIGEAGREAVVPLDRPRDRDRVLAEAGLAGAGGPQRVTNVQVPAIHVTLPSGDGRAAAGAVVDRLAALAGL